jgi:hypothetical protein
MSPDIIALVFILVMALALAFWFMGWHRASPQASRQFWQEVLHLPERKLTEWAERVKRR